MRGGRGGASEVLEVCEGVRCFSVCVARGCVEFLAAITVGAASAASTVFVSRQKNSKIFGITLSAAIYFFLAAETSEFSRIFV